MKRFTVLQYLIFGFITTFLSIPLQADHSLLQRNYHGTTSKDTLSSCPKFADAQNRDEAETNYVIYRDLLKAEKWDEAIKYWHHVYAEAPAADGRRATVYLDGIRFYERFYQMSQDSLEREHYIDRIFELYDEINYCYPTLENIPARKAFDLYRKYPHRATKTAIFQFCKEVLDREAETVPTYFILPASELLLGLIRNRQIDFGQARSYVTKIQFIFLNRIDNRRNRVQKRDWINIVEKVTEKLKELEDVKGFYDCGYFLKKYYAPIQTETAIDCDFILIAYSVFRESGCLDLEQKKFLFGRLKSDCCALGLEFMNWYK